MSGGGAFEAEDGGGGVWRVEPQGGGPSGRVRIYPTPSALRPLASVAWLPAPWSAGPWTGSRPAQAVWTVTRRSQAPRLSVDRTRL